MILARLNIVIFCLCILSCKTEQENFIDIEKSNIKDIYKLSIENTKYNKNLHYNNPYDTILDFRNFTEEKIASDSTIYFINSNIYNPRLAIKNIEKDSVTIYYEYDSNANLKKYGKLLNNKIPIDNWVYFSENNSEKYIKEFINFNNEMIVNQFFHLNSKSDTLSDSEFFNYKINKPKISHQDSVHIDIKVFMPSIENNDTYDFAVIIPENIQNGFSKNFSNLKEIEVRGIPSNFYTEKGDKNSISFDVKLKIKSQDEPFYLRGIIQGYGIKEKTNEELSSYKNFHPDHTNNEIVHSSMYFEIPIKFTR